MAPDFSEIRGQGQYDSAGLQGEGGVSYLLSLVPLSSLVNTHQNGDQSGPDSEGSLSQRELPALALVSS